MAQCRVLPVTETSMAHVGLYFLMGSPISSTVSIGLQISKGASAVNTVHPQWIPDRAYYFLAWPKPAILLTLLCITTVPAGARAVVQREAPRHHRDWSSPPGILQNSTPRRWNRRMGRYNHRDLSLMVFRQYVLQLPTGRSLRQTVANRTIPRYLDCLTSS